MAATSRRITGRLIWGDSTSDGHAAPEPHPVMTGVHHRLNGLML